MRNRPLIWHIFPSYMLVILAALLAITGYSTRAIHTFYLERITGDLEVRARVMGPFFVEALESGVTEEINALCRDTGQNINTRITMIRPDGQVLGDTEEDPESMDNHAQRQEVKEALISGRGAEVRYSETLKRNMVYVALPLTVEDRIVGIIRVSVASDPIRASLIAVHARTALVGVIAAAFAAVISWSVTRRIGRALEEMKQGAERFAQGDFSRKVSRPSSLEMASLADTLNQMARQLNDRIRTVISQRNLQEAVLSSMVEGVLAVDKEQHVISMNDAAARLLGVNPEMVQGQPISEVLNNLPLQDFVGQAMTSTTPSEGEFVLRDHEQQVIQVHGAVLRDAHGEGIGAVVVLNDVTRLRRLERVRRDFVANVSHELRTPITSIKGFVETLLDGALDNPEDARRFLDIVMKQADRLNAILGDLLTLSRIEEGEEKVSIVLEAGSVVGVLNAAVQLCETKAAEKDIVIDLDCDAAIRACINPPLLEQALANLVDNAIKYSEHGAKIRVGAGQQESDVVVFVEDHGCGIPREHLPRLFERFYRVDKARSRSLGGTGLGLSIVKHIAKAHGGRVSVSSAPGQGSIFRIHMPAA